MRAFVTGIGIASPAGTGVSEFLKSLKRSVPLIMPLSLFPVAGGLPLPVGQVPCFQPPNGIPRTHALAEVAAKQALQGCPEPPDAVVVGTTTGGILTTESLLAADIRDPARYLWHTPGSVGEHLARIAGCRGPVLTVSTACASGTTVMVIALGLIRAGSARRVLAVGADSLCRLTYFGFSLLKLVDPAGARPLDLDRAGMSVGEAAAALLLEAGHEAPVGALCELRGGGLSCDAYHVTTPDSEGRGAAAAMKRALEDAGVGVDNVDYINLHGTGTPDNDAAEGRAVREVFGSNPPLLSSTKGIYGHPLAASGAVEAVIGVLSIRHGFVPANVGCMNPDPDLGITPLLEVKSRPLDVVLSNSFGFGGNNACLVVSGPTADGRSAGLASLRGFRVLGSACLSGAGLLHETMAALERGDDCRGAAPDTAVSCRLDAAATRRLKRLPRLALALAISAREDGGDTACSPRSVYFGTGLGALSETYDFLARLFRTGGKFSSPTDFVGSLHNAPAGQAAIQFGSRGANVTVTGTDDSFEEALYCAGHLSRQEDEPILCLAADEAHGVLSPRIDRSTQGDGPVLSDGGGALLLESVDDANRAHLFPTFLGFPVRGLEVIQHLVRALGGAARICEQFGGVMVGIPWAVRDTANEQLSCFLAETGFPGLVVDYRRVLGQYATVSATACVLGLHFVRNGRIPAVLGGSAENSLGGKGILLLGLGTKVSAMAVHR